MKVAGFFYFHRYNLLCVKWKGTMSKRIGVLIGRFQGYHYHHHEHLRRAALDNDVLVVIVGSPNVRKSIKNPWSVTERMEVIYDNVQYDPELASSRVVLRTVPNHPNDAVWADSVRQTVNQFVTPKSENIVTLYGCDKDASTFYLGLFPEWEKALLPQTDGFDATKLRTEWFRNKQIVSANLATNPYVPSATIDWLSRREFNENLQGEWDYYQKEAVTFGNYPFPETLSFNCGDSVLVCHNKVLMIRRKANPGKGCLALPGGFKNRDERFFDAAVRELYEETKIDIPYTHLMRCLVKSQLFDDPSRSLGIPRNTLAAYFDVSKYYMDIELPLTQASDDAAEVEWVPVDGILYRTDVYDDHAVIIYQLTKETA
jgi:bifunctional NMN adenylyltransferase/nudix hydrolase